VFDRGRAFELSAKVALVTGAGRGIGFETARLLLARGATVAVADLDGDAARAAADLGENALALAADVTDRRRMADVVAATVERFGALDVVIANAGVAPPAATLRVIDPAAFERVVEVDLLGVWRTVLVDTDMLRDAFADPVMSGFEQLVPRWAARRLTPAQAAAAIVRGIERRSARVIEPAWSRASFALRGVINPALDWAMERHRPLLDLISRADAGGRTETQQSDVYDFQT
jgi:NAD(P)-dependent dehydrogenase (short-subunit alcohol dehydrogenase family)